MWKVKTTDWSGSFPQDEDEEVYKRDFSAPTLEDHFNKTILPKVMQVWGFSVKKTDWELSMGCLFGVIIFHPSFRSRILDGLVVPSTPTLWIKIPLPLTLHGAKRVPRTQSSLNRRQLGYVMYLSAHLPRRGKPPKLQLLIPAVGQGIWSSVFFNHYSHSSCTEPSGLSAVTFVWRCFVRGLDSNRETHRKAPAREDWRLPT